MGGAHLYGVQRHFRHSDRLPDDVRLAGKRSLFNHCSSRPQVRAAHSAHLSHAAAYFQSGHGRLYGGARRGRDRRHVHRHPVLGAVSQGTAQARGRRLKDCEARCG